MGAMFEDHTKVNEEDIKKAKEEAIKKNLGVEDIGIDNMSDEELDILLANSDSVNKLLISPMFIHLLILESFWLLV